MTDRVLLSSPPKILLIEDNEISRQFISDYLSYCGYHLLSLESGSNLAMVVEQFKPDLILLDLKLPEISGFTLLQQLQTHPAWVAIPVIVVSAYAFEVDRQRALNLGACRYLVKPIQLPQLLQTVQEVLARETP